MKKALLLIVSLFALATVCTAADAKANELLIDDMEDGNYWLPVRDGWEEWGNKFMKNEFSISTDENTSWSTSGSTSVAFNFETFPGTNKTEAAHFYCNELMETNWTGYKKLVIDLNNLADYDIAVQMYTKSGDNWAWGDTDAPTITSGVNHLEFDLTKKVLPNASKVLEVGFVFYGCQGKNTVLVDSIKLVK